MSDSEDEEVMPLVFEFGTWTTRAGEAGQPCPEFEAPTIVGAGDSENMYVCCRDAAEKINEMEMIQPVKRGIIEDFDAFKVILCYAAMKELKTPLSERPIMFVEAANNPKENREKMMEIVFEEFEGQGVSFIPKPVAAFERTALVKGVIIQSGDGETSVVAVDEGVPIPGSLRTFEVAGCDVTNYLSDLASKMEGFSYSAPTKYAQRKMFGDMKAKVCRVALDYSATTKTTKPVEFTLPTEEEIQIGKERYMAPELMFHPEVGEFDTPGIHEIVLDCIKSCDESIQDQLFECVALAGNNCLFPGFGKRLERELRKLAPGKKIEVMDAKCDMAYYGASMIAGGDSFESRVVTKEEYSESGYEVARKKCPSLREMM